MWLVSSELSRQSSRAPLHLGDSPPPGVLAATTYCGRLLHEVTYWATPDCADNAFSTWRRCAACARSLARREREGLAALGAARRG
jgi:hypothetical protein